MKESLIGVIVALVIFVGGGVIGWVMRGNEMKNSIIETTKQSQTNTVEIIQESKQIKEKVKNVNEKCRDIFSVDITECVR